ncbi:cupin domain-containing protein [Streptomyces mauvecolor]|uniref:Cupin domain-containing protein n=1 Tax=Streptomyces mauvecolor TaxID=58345 RepID=A0ABV9UX64_9ACTN
MSELSELKEREPRVQAVDVAEVVTREVAPGITSRRLLPTDHARGWLIDFAPGSEWPEVDVHTEEERYYVISGEVIDVGRVFGAGSYVVFDAGTSHRPRSVVGARMLGISVRVGGDADAGCS